MAFLEATPMAGSDRIKSRFRATLSGNDIWNRVGDVIDPMSGAARKQFRQSSLQSPILSLGALKSLDDIARTIRDKYPGRFDSYQKALDHVLVFFKRYQQA
jgi:hypothetical protein